MIGELATQDGAVRDKLARPRLHCDPGMRQVAGQDH